MISKQKYEVHATHQSGDLWIVATTSRETAEHLAKNFRDDGYSDVKILQLP